MKAMTTTGLLRALLLFGASIDALGADVKIKSVDEFIQFKDDVNSGSDYSGTTVFLDSDLSLAGETFEPIGTSNAKCFLGAFDGQGHVISNLEMNSSTQYVGLFGYSGGFTVKNVILDSSCSITSSYSSDFDDAYIGGILGYYNGDNGDCAIESSVNMGSITYSGDINDNHLYLGGIVGHLYSPNRVSIMNNCANYGDITHSGECIYSYIGGIAGESSGYIRNCLSYGTIIHSGITSNHTFIGGVVGSTGYTTIENCVCGREILLLTSSTSFNYVGSIAGETRSYVSINYTYISSDLSEYIKYGRGTPPRESNIVCYYSTIFELIEAVSIGNYTGVSLIDALNAAADYYYLRDYSHWLLNRENKAVSFTINGRTSPIKMDYQIILPPSLASEGKLWFDGWYTDSGFIAPLTEYDVTEDTQLYGKFEENTNNYTVSFETRREGVSFVPITAQFNSIVALPSDSTGDYCNPMWWENMYGDKMDFDFAMPAHNVTLYAVWRCTRIKTSGDFEIFVNGVKKGVNYSGTTVFLDSDLSLAGETFEPIGDDSNYFSGAFDGQGHVVSNLNINSSSEYTGIFGCSRGLIIKNVIIDSSCSTTSLYDFDSDYAWIGGIIGHCRGYNGPCTIENSVNMVNVTFGGSTRGYLYLGGIAGYLSSYSYDSTVKNCVNYGDLTYSGESGYSYIGGIAGESSGYIYNCLNHGTIMHNGITEFSVFIGGIAGYTDFATIENCVSGGKILANNKTYTGSIAGYIWLGTAIKYCYFTSDLSGYKKYGKGTPAGISNTFGYNSTSFELSEAVSIGSYTGKSLIGALNAAVDYYYVRDFSHWLLNKKRNTVAFTINGRTNTINMDSQVILLPSLANEGNMSFDGWYEDSELTVPLTEFEVTSEAKLYGRYCGPNFTVTLDVNGGNELIEKEMTIGCDRVYGELPNATRTGHTFLGWFTERTDGEKIESGDKVAILSNHIIYAHWSINKYALTFNFDNETEPEVRVLDFNESIVYPENPVREGYTFDGWDKILMFMPANDTTITALWASPLNVTLIVGIVVPIIVLIVVVVVIVAIILYSRMKKVERELNGRKSKISEPLIEAPTPVAD